MLWGITADHQGVYQGLTAISQLIFYGKYDFRVIGFLSFRFSSINLLQFSRLFQIKLYFHV
jgi:hypothetical protein